MLAQAPGKPKDKGARGVRPPEGKDWRFGELDESEDVISVVRACDGYYGDASDLAWYACDSGSPALLIDYDVHTDAHDE